MDRYCAYCGYRFGKYETLFAFDGLELCSRCFKGVEMLASHDKLDLEHLSRDQFSLNQYESLQTGHCGSTGPCLDDYPSIY